jgi:hypothetical protein
MSLEDTVSKYGYKMRPVARPKPMHSTNKPAFTRKPRKPPTRAGSFRRSTPKRRLRRFSVNPYDRRRY